MNSKKLFHPLVLLLAVLTCLTVALPAVVYSEEIEMVNRPVNTTGLTGLLLTTSPYTLDRGTVEIAASIISENSVTPNFTITEYPASISVGVAQNVELSLRGSYINVKEGPSSTAHAQTQGGDLQMSCKWNFVPPLEDSPRPAFAVFLTGIVPTDNNSSLNVSAITHWGMRLGLSAGSEISWREHILGIYADAQVAGNDPTEKRLRDFYDIVNAGLLFPVSKYRNLQMMFEYSRVHGIDRITLAGGDYSALTYGIRLVSERFNITIGSEFIIKNVEGFDNSDRIIGMASVKF